MSDTLTHPRYEPGQVLGRGAQGSVLRVTDREAPERALVAKIWRPGRFPEAILRGEFALLSRLSLPFVVRAHDFAHDTLTGAPFLVEDFVPGADAREYVEHAPSEQRSELLLRLVFGTLRALLHLHEAGFIHGDLKPAHVKVTASGEVTLIDLGSAVTRAAAAGAAGTPGYFAPELLAGARASVASDLFALGALAFNAATGELPSAGARNLRARAPWVEPRLAALVSALLATHPRDRPADASDALARLSALAATTPGSVSMAPIGRERELATLMARFTPGVQYLCGPAGIGKTHLGRELWTQALLSGREARCLGFPHADEARVGQLLAFFRGDTGAWPFGAFPLSGPPLLLVLDPLERAPSELFEALEAFRCRSSTLPLTVLAVCREAPPAASPLVLSPLSDTDFETLARQLGVTRLEELGLAAGVSRGNPGWLVSLRGGAPITREMVLERVQGLSVAAREIVASIALCGGEASETLLQRLWQWEGQGALESLSEAFEAGLLQRQVDKDGARCRLPSPAFSAELAATLATFEVVDRVANAVLEDAAAPAQQLFAVAQASCAPERREELLERAAFAARSTGLSSVEIDALLALLARPEQRSPERLLRLERLTRDAGAPAGHPEVHAWLEHAALVSKELAPLVLRRRAERAARAGEPAEAERLIADALTAARELDDEVGEGFAHGSAAAIALYRADWPRAERELELARKKLEGRPDLDAEELARLEHNAGVVELYAERHSAAAEKFTRSLGIKRTLGDRGGVRSCLLNLSIALISLREFARAEAVLAEAIELARSLSQRAGEAWCLTARVELEVRRGRAQAAEHWLALAEVTAQAAPAVVRADLRLLDAQIALLHGDAARALQAVSQLDGELLAGDASLQVKALLAEGEAHMLRLPAETRRAARLAIRALRVARAGRLAELGERAQGLLARARGRPRRPDSRYVPQVDAESSGEWNWLREFGAGLEPESAALSLCRLVVAATRAERALLAVVSSNGQLTAAFGVDLDGFELSNPKARLEAGFLRALLASAHSLYQPDIHGGSRLAAHAPGVGGQRVVLTLEHRFRQAHFDGLSAETLTKWLTLAQLAARLTKNAVEVGPAPLGAEHLHTTTRQPARNPRRSYAQILGSSAALDSALSHLDAAIDSVLPVLILGETGAGKELFSRALHEHGERADGPFVAVNCAAIADSLFEAELFGHARGAFTGADRVRPGLLARAEGGTLLLDEIGELSLARQATLLRLLETQCYRAVGSDTERHADVRIVAATNRELESEVEGGRFRKDLLFRLNVLQIRVPPLRERKDDVPVLVHEMLGRAARPRPISDAALELLSGYDWPGNVRELQNVIGRLLAHGGERIEVPELPRSIRAAAPRSAPRAAQESQETSQKGQVERALLQAEGNITRAAQALGITRHGLKKRMLRFGLRTRGQSRG